MPSKHSMPVRRFRLPFVLIAALVLIVGALTGSGDARTKSHSPLITVSNGHASQPNSAAYGTDKTPCVVKMITTPKSAEEFAQDKSERHQKSLTDWWMVKLTGVLAFIGIAQTIAFWVQARRLKQTIETMETGAEIEQRAYVYLQPLALPTLVPDAIIRLPVQLYNSGKTPAHNLTAKGAMDILSWPPPNPFPADYPIQDMSQMIIGAGQTTHSHIESHRHFSTQEIADVFIGQHFRLYIYGEMTYEDVFGKTRRKPFRLQFGGASGLIFCTEGNELG